MKDMKGKRKTTSESKVLLYLMVPLAATLVSLQQAIFGDKCLHTQPTISGLLKWMNARELIGFMDVKKYTAQLGLPPTSLLKAMSCIAVSDVDFGQKMGSDNIILPIVREPHKSMMDIATLKEILSDEELLHQTKNMDQISDKRWSGSQRVMDMAQHELMAQTVLDMESPDALVALDVYDEMVEGELMRLGATTCNTIVGLAGVDGQVTVGHMDLEEAQVMKTQSAYTIGVMEHGSAAA